MKIAADTNIPFVEECFSSIGDVEVVSGREMTAEVVKDVDILLVRSITKVNKDLLDGSKVRFVGTATIGIEHVDTEYLAKNNIGFTSAPGSNANSVAEYIVAALLSVSKKHNIQLAGKSIGIVGVGNVGSRVAEKTTALGIKTVLNDPPLGRETKDTKYRPLSELFDCDFITLHTPLTSEGIDKTFHLADEAFFRSLKDKCVFINTSRGAVVDTQALKNALEAGKLGAAVLDVWENEPDIDMELLRKVDLSTPHIAGYSYDGKVGGMIMIYNAVCEYLGIEAEKRLDDFLGEPLLPEIKIDSQTSDLQDTIHQTVQQVYPINRDDFNMRELAIVDEDKRPAFFDDLRKDYQVRREFQNTKIILAEKNAELAKKFKGIGFKIEAT